MSITLSRPKRKLTVVSVRHIYRCKEYPRWRIERSHITVGEGGAESYPDLWQVWYLPDTQNWNEHLIRWESCWELVSEHRTKAAAIRAMGKAIRKLEE